MKTAPAAPHTDPDLPAHMPPWVTGGRAETAEDAAFLSGSALAHLHLILSRPDVPQALLRERLALRAAEVCVGFAGRPERSANLRDAVCLLRPGDLPGPAGEVYQAWQRAVARPMTAAGLGRALPALMPVQVSEWTQAGQGAPVPAAAQVLEAVLRDLPRAVEPALILADAALSRGLGWDRLVPLLALGLRRADLRAEGADLQRACYDAVRTGAIEASILAADLTRRAAHLQSVAPKLRAKAAAGAVQMFLTSDAVAPAALPLPDRAARRLCDRLVDLGAVRELTGRDTFRLYGV